MRLIDADELRKLFKEEFKRTKQMIVDGQTHLDTLAEGYAEADHLLRFRALTVDAVPVVRCRDCKYWGDDAGTLKTSSGEAFARCVIHNHFVGGRHAGWCPKENDFCSRGESKEDKK